MRTFAEKPRAPEQTTSAKPQSFGGKVQHLQRIIGNQEVTQLEPKTENGHPNETTYDQCVATTVPPIRQ